MSKLPSYQVALSCNNYGHLDSYDIPIRREIINYQCYPEYDVLDPGKYTTRMVNSAVQRPNGTDKQILLCTRCKLPRLQSAFYMQNFHTLGVTIDG